MTSVHVYKQTTLNMADFFVALLSTLMIVFITYVLWKWKVQRNWLTSETTKKHVTRADMLQSRLKRFGGADPERIKENSPNISTQEKSPSVLDDLNDTIITQGDLENQSQSDTKSTSHLQRESHALPDNVSLQPTTLITNEKLENKSEPEADKPRPMKHGSRKWVTLSSVETEGRSDPVTQPLTNLEELTAWTEGFDELNVSSVPLNRLAASLERRPRTLVCHDMKGGYVQDRFVQGYPSINCYRIYHWQYIDIFVYFSHNFITIPPPCWTNAAHRHSVLVLGTFITEWQDGAVRCGEIFKTQSTYQRVADQLVSIANYYGFDGWLINIENPIQPAQMNNLVAFVKYLTDQMHQTVPGSLIIWYDSVTYNGELKWQNKLNAENRVFFDVSDGIFLNYGWSQTDLTLSVRGSGPDRRYDVYVGVDVFGRGMFGGGGWNTNKATNVIKNNDLSTALFAPGWVYEKYESTFKVSQDKFWASVGPDCTTHSFGPALPFVTSFCQGYGNKFFNNGKILFNRSWTHLSAQEVQPSFVNQIYSLGNQHGVLITSFDHQTEESYRGGGCLKLQGTSKSTNTAAKAVVRLFKTDIAVPSTVLINLTIKVEDSASIDVAVQLHVDRKPNYIMLCPMNEGDIQDSKKIDTLNAALMQRYGIPRSKQIDPERQTSISVGQEHYRSFVPVTGEHRKRLVEMCCDTEESGDSHWCTRYYLLAEKDLKGSHIKEIRLVLMNKTTSDSIGDTHSTPFQLFVGEIKIVDAVTLRRPLPTISGLKCLESEIKSRVLDANTFAITLTLSWNYDMSNAEAWQRFQVYNLSADGSPVFLGLAFSQSFVVSDLAVPRSHTEARFIVQAVSISQRKQALRDCPSVTVYWL